MTEEPATNGAANGDGAAEGGVAVAGSVSAYNSAPPASVTRSITSIGNDFSGVAVNNTLIAA